jgi:hypothetical protein
MIGRLARSVSARFHGNFLLADRTDIYRSLLASFRERGFVALTFAGFARLRIAGSPPPPRVLLLRHDIDTDPAYVPRWLEVEREFGFVSTSYYRLRTLDVATMRAIAEGGGEASYHYEELASHAKAFGLRTREAALAALPAVRSRFAANLSAVRRMTGLPIETVASHGDFANRALGVTNAALIDRAFADSLGILAEAYEPLVQEGVSCRVSDQHYPDQWRFSVGPGSFAEVLAKDEAVVEILTHPRHWRAAPSANLREDADRIVSSVFFKAGVPLRGYADMADRRSRLMTDQGNTR